MRKEQLISALHRSQRRDGHGVASALQHCQEVRCLEDHPDEPGRSLVTLDHEVIRRWAQSRHAVPAKDRFGLLRLDFGRSGLRHIDWHEWFELFDSSQATFLFQQQSTDGGPSNFFQIAMPPR
jgi:hypothetical protein